MTQAAIAGIMPEEFYLSTPRELRAVFKADAKRYKRLYKVAAFQAWQNAALRPRPKGSNFPTLARVMAGIDRDEKQSPEQLRSSLLGWHKQVGGTTRGVPKGSIKRPF